MESSLPVSELELETRSAISMRAETNPGPFSWLLDYGRSCETFFRDGALTRVVSTAHDELIFDLPKGLVHEGCLRNSEAEGNRVDEGESRGRSPGHSSPAPFG